MKTFVSQHWKHLLPCAVIVLVGLGAGLVGLGGLGALVVVACPLMMLGMAWGMLRGAGTRSDH